MRFAVNLSVITFNGGMDIWAVQFVEGVGVELGPRPLNFFREADRVRVSKSDRVTEEAAKRKRKAKSR